VSETVQPRRLGDFEMVREVGRGGMGVVYEARQVSLNRKVALKVLSGGLGLTPKAVQRFHREAEAAAKLHHTNIVPVYATGEQDSTYFYAMELIDGPSLDHVIRQLRVMTRKPRVKQNPTPFSSRPFFFPPPAGRRSLAGIFHSRFQLFHQLLEFLPAGRRDHRRGDVPRPR